MIRTGYPALDALLLVCAVIAALGAAGAVVWRAFSSAVERVVAEIRPVREQMVRNHGRPNDERSLHDLAYDAAEGVLQSRREIDQLRRELDRHLADAIEAQRLGHAEGARMWTAIEAIAKSQPPEDEQEH